MILSGRSSSKIVPMTMSNIQDGHHGFSLVEKFDIFENIVLQNHWME